VPAVPLEISTTTVSRAGTAETGHRMTAKASRAPARIPATDQQSQIARSRKPASVGKAANTISTARESKAYRASATTNRLRRATAASQSRETAGKKKVFSIISKVHTPDSSDNVEGTATDLKAEARGSTASGTAATKGSVVTSCATGYVSNTSKRSKPSGLASDSMNGQPHSATTNTGQLAASSSVAVSTIDEGQLKARERVRLRLLKDKRNMLHQDAKSNPPVKPKRMTVDERLALARERAKENELEKKRQQEEDKAGRQSLSVIVNTQAAENTRKFLHRLSG